MKTMMMMMMTVDLYSALRRAPRQIFRIGTVCYAQGLWRMRRHGPVIAHCTDSVDFPVSKTISISSASTALRVPVHCEQECLQCWSKRSDAERWITVNVKVKYHQNVLVITFIVHS